MKKIIRHLLPAVILMLICSMPVQAANYKKVTMKKNGYITVSFKSLSRTQYPGFNLCDAKKKKIRTYAGTLNDREIPVFVRKGTYYIRSLRSFSVKTSYKVPSLTAGKTRSFYNGALQDAHYFKLTASATGYLSIYTTNIQSVTLCDTSLNELSWLSEGCTDWSWPTKDSSTGKIEPIHFAVEKGQTYYLKADGYARHSSTVRYTLTRASVLGGSTKSKAYILKRNRTLKSLVLHGETNTCWFKYRIPAGCSSFKIELTSHVRGGYLRSANADGTVVQIKKEISPSFRCVLYDSDGKAVRRRTLQSGTVLQQKAAAGNLYYLKITGDSAKNSGYLEIRTTAS